MLRQKVRLIYSAGWHYYWYATKTPLDSSRLERWMSSCGVRLFRVIKPGAEWLNPGRKTWQTHGSVSLSQASKSGRFGGFGGLEVWYWNPTANPPIHRFTAPPRRVRLANFQRLSVNMLIKVIKRNNLWYGRK